jgi:phage gp36-like protein
MSAWNTITVDNIMSRFSDAEKAALAALQSAPDQITRVLADVTDSVRGKIKSGGGQLGPDGTLPNSLKLEVVSLTLWLWITGFSKNEKLQTDGRKQNYQDSLAVLKEVASGKQKVELPDPGETDNTAAPANAIQLVSAEPRQFKRCKMRGF